MRAEASLFDVEMDSPGSMILCAHIFGLEEGDGGIDEVVDVLTGEFFEVDFEDANLERSEHMRCLNLPITDDKLLTWVGRRYVVARRVL